jgi:hypothetical protein
MFPKAEFQEIIDSLRGSSRLEEVDVQSTIATAGRLRKAVQISYYSGVAATFRGGHTARSVQAGYIAWFENSRKPTLVLIEETKADGSARTYEIAEGDPASLIKSFGYPLLLFALALYMVCRQRPSSVNHAAV